MTDQPFEKLPSPTPGATSVAPPNLEELLRQDVERRARACANEVQTLLGQVLARHNCIIRYRYSQMPPEEASIEMIFIAQLPGQRS